MWDVVVRVVVGLVWLLAAVLHVRGETVPTAGKVLCVHVEKPPLPRSPRVCLPYPVARAPVHRPG